MNSSEGFKVFVRSRPLSAQERKDGREKVVTLDASSGQVVVSVPSEPEKVFTFDQVFDDTACQEDVYAAAAAPLVEAILQGFNATVFAFGQTGSGKTYTMEGQVAAPEQRGIIPRVFEHIFDEIAQGASERQYLVRASHCELYNEEVRDLLAPAQQQQRGGPQQQRLELRDAPGGGGGVQVRGLKEYVVRGAAEMAALLELGRGNRSVGATLMNQESSRSHSIFTITVETLERPPSSEEPAPAGGRPKPAAGGAVRVGKLNLVDLAGSERQAKTQASGQRLREAAQINLSLSALGNVIFALTEGAGAGSGGGSTHVPYRDSKLTRLLQDSLGGSAKAVMIASVGPADWNRDETLSTLRYAARATRIKNQPRVNEDPKEALIRQFQAEIAALKAQLADRQLSGELAAASLAGEGVGGGGGGMRAHQQIGAAEQPPSPAGNQADLEWQARHRQALELRMQAMSSQILRGGQNLAEKVEALEAAAARQGQALVVQRAAAAQAEARIAELMEATAELGGRYATAQEEMAEKGRHLQRVVEAAAACQADAQRLAHEWQAEKEYLLGEVQALAKQVKLKDSIIAAYIPPEYLAAIMRRCMWQEQQQRWQVEGPERAGGPLRLKTGGAELAHASHPEGPLQKGVGSEGGGGEDVGSSWSIAAGDGGIGPRQEQELNSAAAGAARPRTAALLAGPRPSLSRPLTALGRDVHNFYY